MGPGMWPDSTVNDSNGPSLFVKVSDSVSRDCGKKKLCLVTHKNPGIGIGCKL